METKPKAKGSWGVRFFIVVLGVILGVLLFWLLSFVERDIGSVKGPDWDTVRREFVSQEMDDTRDSLQKEVDRLKHRIDTLHEQRRLLNDSTAGYQNTMNQLLSIQKQYIEKGQEFPPENVQTLQESQRAFLQNQQQNQHFIQQISDLVEQRQQKDNELADAAARITALEGDARQKQNKLWERYRMKVAALKLSFLVPVFLAVSFLFMKYRTGAYWPLVWAAFVAAFIKVAMVAHYYFPQRYFKYVAILVVLAIVLRLLVYLIKMIAAPKKDLLVKQYQQFYDKHLCPVCTKPIKTGPLRYAAWKKKATVLAPQAADTGPQPYTCPSCGTNLYNKCDTCGHIRHSLLPYCEHCGVEKKD